MKLDKAISRDRKISRRRNGHKSGGKSIKLIQEQLKKKAEAIKKEREEKILLELKLLEEWE